LATRYEMRELSKGLCIRVSRDLEKWERISLAGLAATIAGGMSAHFLGGWWSLGLSAIAAIATYMAVSSRKAQLLVTNVEFVTTGDLGRRIQAPRIVCTADVRGLEFWCGSGLFRSGPDGLYVLTTLGSKCILPFLDYAQSDEVIRAIGRKFPGLAERWRTESSTSRPGPLSLLRT